MSKIFSLRISFLIIAITASGLISRLAHADLYVISNLATQITSNEIKDVFTGEKQFADSTRLIPVDNGPAQEDFLASVLGMKTSRYNTIWTKKSFREGLTPPSVKAGDAEVLAFVRNTRGGIGYVATRPGGVNIIQKYLTQNP